MKSRLDVLIFTCGSESRHGSGSSCVWSISTKEPIVKSNLLLSLGGCVASSIGVLCAGMDPQQGQPGSAPGGTPSQQPQPKNPTPRPANPGQPGNEQPGQNQPSQGDPDRQTPIERQPGKSPANRSGSSRENPRYFNFTDPSAEPRFRESASQLARLERTMSERNQRLVERLGSLRQLPADRQNGALLDLLQDILQENAQLQEYLARSRTLFTGDLEDPNDPEPPSATPNQPDNSSRPAPRR
jgi:hypothetical protein